MGLISAQRARRMYAGRRGGRAARFFSRLWRGIIIAGLPPRRWVVLEVKGSTSGLTRSFPLGLADVQGRWYLVSMLGECAWVRNVRAAQGHAVLRRRDRRPVTLVELVDEPDQLRAAVLQRFLEKAPGGRPHIAATKDSDQAELVAASRAHPIFEVSAPDGLP